MNLKHSWNSSQYEKSAGLQAAAADDLINTLEIGPCENILDIGCGLGNITAKIASLAYNGQVLGIDASSSMIEKAEENLLLNNPGNIGFRVMSAAELHFDKEFDVVFSNSVLHWVKKQDKALESIYHCLKPGGRIGLQFPILDTSHPMVSLVEKAVHSLKLEHKYADWIFPWYVPKSADAYLDLLEKIQFKNVVVKAVETSHAFETVPAVIEFFTSVGLDLFLKPISKKEGILLKKEMTKQIEHDTIGSEIEFGFQRLYVQACL